MFLDFLGCVGEIRHTLIFIHVVVFASVFLALYSIKQNENTLYAKYVLPKATQSKVCNSK